MFKHQIKCQRQSTSNKEWDTRLEIANLASLPTSYALVATCTCYSLLTTNFFLIQTWLLCHSGNREQVGHIRWAVGVPFYQKVVSAFAGNNCHVLLLAELQHA